MIDLVDNTKIEIISGFYAVEKRQIWGWIATRFLSHSPSAAASVACGQPAKGYECCVLCQEVPFRTLTQNMVAKLIKYNRYGLWNLSLGL
jgi:hypothetical protein